MASAFDSIQYQRVLSTEDEEDDDSSELPPTVVTTRGTDKASGRWNHIENLDEFFTRVYRYHKAQGFACLLLNDVFVLIQYVFIVLFATFLAVCIDYKKLFEDPNPEFATVIDWQKIEHMPTGLVICLVVALLFWMVQVIKVFRDSLKAWEMRQFFYVVLRINDNDLQNMQWRDVQKKLMEVQKDHFMCIHKQKLSELDIHHRILRQKNYMIALQNKGVLPCIYRFPLIGKRTFLTEGLKFNLQLILFTGPGAPFEKSWQLKSEFKDYSCRSVLANRLSRHIFLLGIINLLLCPFVLIYQILYSFFRYAELIKRSPDLFGARRWSPHGRLYLRHFNEMDHEFQSRLSKAYLPATKYMNGFMSPIMTIFARNIAFFAGALLAVLLGLSFYDQDVLTAENVISFMAVLGIIIKICAGFIPDEYLVFCPELLMKQILSNSHYIPEEWKGRAHTNQVRDEFSRLFQYKFIYLLEELLSAILTPFVLCFDIRHKSLQIIDFFRNFTVNVADVGDVCSFAQMDVRKHGKQQFASLGNEDQLLSAEQQAENGKTELSLLHFSIKNPTWQPTDSGRQFIEDIKEHAIQESLSLSQSYTTRGNSLHQPYQGIGENNMTAFVGLTSLGQPAQTNEMMLEQENAILNTSMMYMHGAYDRGMSSSEPAVPSTSQINNRDNILRKTWPGAFYTTDHLAQQTGERPHEENTEDLPPNLMSASSYSSHYPHDDSWHHESRF